MNIVVYQCNGLLSGAWTCEFVTRLRVAGLLPGRSTLHSSTHLDSKYHIRQWQARADWIR
jgi:hypothetical protein